MTGSDTQLELAARNCAQRKVLSTSIAQKAQEHEFYLDVLRRLEETEMEANWHGKLDDHNAASIGFERQSYRAKLAAIQQSLFDAPCSSLADAANKAKVVIQLLDASDIDSANQAAVALCRDLVTLKDGLLAELSGLRGQSAA